jgi:hypothetical protein
MMRTGSSAVIAALTLACGGLFGAGCKRRPAEGDSVVAPPTASAPSASAGAAPAPAEAPLPVLQLPGLHAPPGDVEAGLRMRWQAPFDLREGALPSKAKRRVESCVEASGVAAEDVLVEDEGEGARLRRELLRCWALRKVAGARPARGGTVRALLDTTALGPLLPAGLAPFFGDDEERLVAAAQKAGKSWAALDSTLTFQRDGDGWESRRELAVRSAEVGGVLQWWAAGDMDGDGLDDLLGVRSVAPAGGSAREVAAFVLTRGAASEPVRLLERRE